MYNVSYILNIVMISHSININTAALAAASYKFLQWPNKWYFFLNNNVHCCSVITSLPEMLGNRNAVSIKHLEKMQLVVAQPMIGSRNSIKANSISKTSQEEVDPQALMMSNCTPMSKLIHN